MLTKNNIYDTNSVIPFFIFVAVLNSNAEDKEDVMESQALIDKYLEITELTVLDDGRSAQ